jgi:hypothetical protein
MTMKNKRKRRLSDKEIGDLYADHSIPCRKAEQITGISWNTIFKIAMSQGKPRRVHVSKERSRQFAIKRKQVADFKRENPSILNKDLALMFGMAAPSVTKALQEHGLAEARGKSPDRDMTDDILTLAARGMGQGDIARKVGSTVDDVVDVLWRYDPDNPKNNGGEEREPEVVDLRCEFMPGASSLTQDPSRI